MEGERATVPGGALGYRGESLVIAIIQKFITQQVMLRGGGDAASQSASHETASTDKGLWPDKESPADSYLLISPNSPYLNEPQKLMKWWRPLPLFCAPPRRIYSRCLRRLNARDGVMGRDRRTLTAALCHHVQALHRGPRAQ